MTSASTAVSLRYEYGIKDHLGNARITFTDKNANGVVEVTNTASNEVLQENHYYPFGLNMSGPWMNDAAALDTRYQYNGKELNDDFGLNWNDYGARWYDATVGRWWSVDSLAPHPNQIDKSPYAYVWDNPVKLTDPDGNFPFPLILPLIPAFIEAVVLVGEGLLAGTAIIGTAVLAANAPSTDAQVPLHAQLYREEFKSSLQQKPGQINASQKSEKNDSKNKQKTSGKNEKHGDGGRTLSKSEKQIGELKKKAEDAPNKKERQKIEQKIQNIEKNAQKKKSGEEHSRTTKH